MGQERPRTVVRPRAHHAVPAPRRPTAPRVSLAQVRTPSDSCEMRALGLLVVLRDLDVPESLFVCVSCRHALQRGTTRQ